MTLVVLQLNAVEGLSYKDLKYHSNKPKLNKNSLNDIIKYT